MKVQFKEWLCQVVLSTYGVGGGVAIQLVLDENDPSANGEDSFAGEPIARASVNLTDWMLQDGEIAIKAYNENEGMIEALVAAGILQPAHIHLDLNAGRHGDHKRCLGGAQEARTYVGICRFTDAARAQWPKELRIPADDAEECDECGEYIDGGDPSMVSDQHADSCSLHPSNVTAATA